MRKNIIILFALCLSLSVAAQTYSTRIFHPQVRTLRVQTVESWERKQAGAHVAPMRPILVYNGQAIDGSEPDNTLEISFDELSHEPHFYSYTLLHLNHDNQPSALMSNEYVSGFTTADITDAEHSLNTSQLYTHYRFTFPNEDMQLTRSGNYALIIYEDGDKDKIIATVLVEVVEPLVNITGQVRSNTDIELSGRYQQLDFDINTAAINLKDPGEIQVVIQQNGRLDNQKTGIRPTFVESKRLRYMNNKQLIFEGGNEYRHFDIFSTFYAGSGVDRILHDRNDYHALLLPGDILAGRQYIHEFDTNGQMVVNAERTDNDDTEAEYMWVHWILPMKAPMLDGNLYVGGDLFENRLTSDNRMNYDADNHCYWLTSLVKQGGADYQFWFVEKGQKEATLQRTEGSFWQAQNEYRIFVYWRAFGDRADRLIGIGTL